MPLGVLAFSTTRRGGVSQGNYGEFNINEFCGDNLAHVAENRKRLAAELSRTAGLGFHTETGIGSSLGIADDHIILPHQVHGVEVRHITPYYFSMSEDERKRLLDGVDAVTTNLKGVCVGVSTADCIPVLLYDEAHHAAAAIHAGWRGTVARIVQNTVQEMESIYHTDPGSLKAVIGPGISLANFEVGDEVYEAFQQAGFPMAEIAEHFEKWHINLPLCNKLTLMQCGVAEENIQDCGICTVAHCDEFFSARKLGIKSGRIYSAILLK